MGTQKAAPVHFYVLTPENLQTYAKEGKHDGIGQGTTPPSFEKAQLTWTGLFLISGTDYLLVTEDSSAPAPVDVRLTLEGAGVSQ